MRRDGLNVEDATAKLDVKVTDRDISKATQADAATCAIALGCKRKPGIVDVRIGATTAFVDYGDRIERYVIDSDTRQRLAVFDRDGYFAPGVYTLLPPPKGRRIGDRAGTASGSNTRTPSSREKSLRGRVSAGMFTA